MECTSKWIKDKKTGKEHDTDVWTLGGKSLDKWGIDVDDFIRLCGAMTPRSEADAIKYLHKLIGKEWNAKNALRYFGKEMEGWLFYFDESDAQNPWCGSDWADSQCNIEKAEVAIS